MAFWIPCQPGIPLAFFFFATLAASGIFLRWSIFSVGDFLHTPADGQVIIRQSTWFGVYVGILAWLQLGRVLTLPIAIFIAAGLSSSNCCFGCGKKAAGSRLKRPGCLICAPFHPWINAADG
jgi:hypothetical protein